MTQPPDDSARTLPCAPPGKDTASPSPGAAPVDPENSQGPLEDAVTVTTGETSPAASREVPGYEMLGELGRGGMGVVFKARQIQLNRTVALKMILSGGHAGEEDLARFRSEAEAIARLQHPNIIQIYEIGEHEGKPFFSLEFCAGGSLAGALDGKPLPIQAAAQLVASLARAIHAAHEQGIVHRDLKPANILLRKKSAVRNPKSEKDSPSPLSDFGFRTADFDLKVTDFGLAKKLNVEQGQTRSGVIMGTPSYMAPEQAGQAKQVGPAADVYALGVILYELLTGRPPFQAETPLDTLLQVLERQPLPPQLLNPKVPRDLETICLKCLEKVPQRRYSSAAALADDLEHFVAGESISARSYNALDWVVRALEHSGYDVMFQGWSTMLLWFAAILAILFSGSAWLIAVRPLYLDFWLVVIHTAGFAVMGVVFWRLRQGRVLPTTTAERLMWTLWIGFFVACYMNGFVSRLLSTPENPHNELALYPRFAILSGLAFLILGCSYWGICYLFGVGFFVLAVLMTFQLPWAPVEFGLLWDVALVTIALRLRRLGREGKP